MTILLYERGYSKEQVRTLYEFLDGIMVLPQAMENLYHQQIFAYEEKHRMPYITTAERMGMEKGMEKATQQNILKVLEVRFAEVPERTATQVHTIDKMEQLNILLEKAVTVESLAAFSQLLEQVKK